jgi:hypothetical protein
MPRRIDLCSRANHLSPYLVPETKKRVHPASAQELGKELIPPREIVSEGTTGKPDHFRESRNKS